MTDVVGRLAPYAFILLWSSSFITARVGLSLVSPLLFVAVASHFLVNSGRSGPRTMQSTAPGSTTAKASAAVPMPITSVPGPVKRATEPRMPCWGYYYRMAKTHGAHAPGRAYDDVVIGGGALIAYPAEYVAPGAMTFMVSHDGIVHQKDPSPDTTAAARALSSFDPDPTRSRF